MQLRTNETLYEGGGIVTNLGDLEVRALRLSVDFWREEALGSLDITEQLHSINLTGGGSSDVYGGLDILSYDQLAPMLHAGPNADGRYEETWTRDQVLMLASCTYAAARAIHERHRSPVPDVPDPVLGTVVAIMEAVEAGNAEAAEAVITDFRHNLNFDPHDLGERGATPGRRVCLGFEAARVVLLETESYPQALAVINEFNESPLGV